ncbi:MAG: acyl-ACP--UDP-N-acetylglucosamine O-acyltransferase [Gammaproteobacteria bacterium]|nr:acyl-ACP--UDP-N-acetylglucosamine O-acyltransferase [Gammaproteobacteria bacterium]
MIDKTAIIDPKAAIGANVKIGAYSIIGPDVEIGDGTEIGPHVVIQGPTTIGRNNTIFQFASIGAAPQDLKYQGEPTRLEIGDGNQIREFVTLNRGTAQGGDVTKIGSRNLFMAYVHVAHDCIIGNDIVFANNATLAGHVEVHDYAVFGGFAAAAQRVTIGAYSFVAGDTGVAKDVLPYVLVSSYHGETKSYGLNLVGLRRKGFSRDAIKALKAGYHMILQEGLTTKEVIPKLEEMVVEHSEIQLFIDMLAGSKRGIIR